MPHPAPDTRFLGRPPEGRSLTVAARIFFSLVTRHLSRVTAVSFLVTFYSSLVPVLCAQGVITTAAGNGRALRGEGGPANTAAFGELQSVAVDSVGNVYAADRTNNKVVKISPTGILTVAAGNGIQGFSGEGGPATAASLDFPRGLAVDSAGNLYIAVSDSQRIRKVSPDGIITTVAGSGSFGFTGDGGPATRASLANPRSVAVDAAGNLYIADSSNYRIRKVSTDGIISTLAGNGILGFSGDGGPATDASLNFVLDVAADAAGNVYIADTSNQRIRRVAPNGVITTVAGNGVQSHSGDGGPATEASLFQPQGIGVDAAGNVFVATLFGQRVRKFVPGGVITTVAGSGFGFSGDGGPATSALFNNPQDVAVDATGYLYIADTLNGRIRRVNTSGIITTHAGTGFVNFTGDGGPATSALLSAPDGVKVDAAGNLYIADRHNQRIRKVSPSGIITTAAGNGTAGFSGDGGPPTAASLNEPRDIAVDAAGNLYIADTVNNRIRKVSFTGLITTVAGNGQSGFTGDGGPAVSAAFRQPQNLALDAAGNLYISDANNHRVRRVTPSGVITTVAGNGAAGFSGDGGPAINASLRGPRGLVFDANGNLYISDYSNNRVRRVTPNGTISTVAGNGVSGFGGDGGPATDAILGNPLGVAVDATGNLYISSNFNARVRKIAPDGIITTVAGRSGAGFSGDGGPATAAALDIPSGIAVDAGGNLYIADTANDRIRKVLAVLPPFSLAPSTLNFSAAAGAQIIAAQKITVSSAVAGLAWTALTLTESGGGWLAVSPGAGFAPGTLDVSVNAANLPPGTYQGTVTVQAPLAEPSAQTVAVTLRVEAPLPPQLAVEPPAISFEGTVGAANPPSQAVRIRNAGGGLLNWVAVAATSSGGNWLTVSPASGSASADSAGLIQVSANGTGLAPGVYSGSVHVESATTEQTRTVAVTLLLASPTATILVSQSGLLFTGVEGGTAAPLQSFAILNTGQGTMNWTAEASTLSGGDWLSVSPTSGSSVADSLAIPLAEVSVRVAGLRAGAYGGLIRVNATGAGNAPQFVAVTLHVLPPGSNPGVIVRPTGLIFAARAGSTSPGSQTVRLGTAFPGSVEGRSGLLTYDGGDWLAAAPRNALLSSGNTQASITVQPTLGSLAPGIYRGALTLLFSDGSPAQVVNVLFLVVGQAGIDSAVHSLRSGLDSREADGDCVPTQLFATHRTMGTNFASPVGWPSTIEAQVADDCGNAVANATVVVRFSNGDPPVVLNSLRNGLHVGTWRPATTAGQVTVTVRAELPPLVPVEVQAQGQVSPNPSAPALSVGGIVNAASFAGGEPVAPGEIITVLGRNLARGQNAAARLPLERTLGGATVNIGGIEAPLFYAGEEQINAQVPFELAPNTRPHVVVRTTRADGLSALTLPETITVAAARPAIFSLNQQGSGPGAILNQGNSLNSATNAAARGSVIQVYATGLGATNPAVASGQPAPADPPAQVVVPVEARIGGQPAQVEFARLAPGFVGFYQVNVVIPPTAPPGPAVELTLLQNGVPSNTVTLAIQ